MSDPEAFRDGGDAARAFTELGAALRRLPLVPPPRSAWPALLAAHRAAHAPRRVARWPSAAAAGLAALAALGLWFAASPTRESPPRTAAPVSAAAEAVADAPSAALLARLVAQNHVYEAALKAPGLQATATSAGVVLAENQLADLIGMLDLTLSSTTDAGEQADLWARRLVLLRELIALRAGGVEPDATLASATGHRDAPWPLN